MLIKKNVIIKLDVGGVYVLFCSSTCKHTLLSLREQNSIRLYIQAQPSPPVAWGGVGAGL